MLQQGSYLMKQYEYVAVLVQNDKTLVSKEQDWAKPNRLDPYPFTYVLGK